MHGESVPHMPIETERLLIRPYQPDDLRQLIPILTDPVTMGFWPKPFTPAEVEEWIAKNIRRYEDDGVGRYPLFLKGSEQLIGDCGVVKTEIDGEPANDLGYIIYHPFWGRGFASEAALAVKSYAFTVLGLPSLHANMPIDHHASKHVAEKLGMRLVREFFNSRNRNIRTYLYKVEPGPKR